MAREFQQRCGDFGQRTAISVLLYILTLLLHSLVTASLPTRRPPAPINQRTVRSWRKIDQQVLAQAVKDASLNGSPPLSS